MPYRYEPREHMLNPKSFGRHSDALWKKYQKKSQRIQLEVAASYQQHLAACQTLTVAANKGWTMTDLHARFDKPVKVDALRRVLYGEKPADWDDIVGWARAVGDVTVIPAPADLARMMPPT